MMSRDPAVHNVRPLRAAEAAAVLIAVAAAGIASEASPYAAIALALAWVAGVLGVRWLVMRFHGGVTRRVWDAAVAGVVVAGLAWRAAGEPLPTEWLVLLAMRDALLALTAVPARRHAGVPRGIIVGVGLFLVLACSVLTGGTAAVVMTLAYAGIGAVWLAAEASLGDQTRVGGGTIAAAAVVAAGGVAAWVVRDEADLRHNRGVAAVVASSGGDARGHDAAAGGIGDGPDQVAGADSDAGFDTSDVFCETDGQCLYDAFLETYGQAPQITAQITAVDRAEWLTLEKGQVGSHREQDLRSGRDRQAPPRKLGVRRESPAHAEASAGAVLWVEADADAFPLRLPVLAFDHYHGGHWHEAADQAVMTAMDNADASGRFVPVDQPTGGAWGRGRTVTIATGAYDGNVLPLPNGLTAFTFGRVRRADLFGSAKEGMLRVNRREIPAGSVIRATYRSAVAEALRREAFAHAAADDSSATHTTAASLAAGWAGHLPRGWDQIDAVVRGLRAHATVGEAGGAACDHACPVETFLHDTRRGDPHLFASAAVLMLRSLDYDVRLAGGFYASEADVDPVTGKAAVLRRHAHVWPQVRLSKESGTASSLGRAAGIARGGQWIDLEPTPGYALADGAPTATQRAAAWWREAASFVRDNAWNLVAVGLVATCTFVLRRRIVTLADEAVWHASRTTGRRRIIQTVRLIERRCRRRGVPRPAGTCPVRWLETSADPSHRQLAPLAEWAMYAPAVARVPADMGETCRIAVRPRRIRRAVSRTSSSASFGLGSDHAPVPA